MCKKVGLNPGRKRLTGIAALTVAAVLVLTLFIGWTIRSVNEKVSQTCFDELADTSKLLAKELKKAIETDRTILSAIATLIAHESPTGDEKLCSILSAYELSASYISYLELLRPDGTMLDTNGSVRDVSAALDFAAEADRGMYVSGILQSTLDPAEKVIRNAVPVTQNGKTIGMLYGTIRLSRLAAQYRADIYNGQAYVFLEEGGTGDFLLDTWHGSAGNIRDFTNRRLLPGFSWEQVMADLHSGASGKLGLHSTLINKVVYIHYEPVGINDWNVMVMVKQESAMEKSLAISASLYLMAAVIGVVMLLYMVCVINGLLGAYRQVRRLGREDQNTGLQNRNAFDHYVTAHRSRTFASITCVYADANGLHELNNQSGHAAGDHMLRAIASALESRFPHACLYRIGGDEFIAFCENASLTACNVNIQNVAEQLEDMGYSISYGVVCRENETGLDRVIHEADEQMLKHKQLYYVKHPR